MSAPVELAEEKELLSSELAGNISAIVPARNEEATIATCVKALGQQPEIAEILVVDDQSVDSTGQVVRTLKKAIPELQLLQTQGVPSGWVGKNRAAWLGAQRATKQWLLFTDADGELLAGAARHALDIVQETGATLVSFSPEQVVQEWYEKALIPCVYCRLAKLFSYAEVNNPDLGTAAANGQFLMIRRDAYDAIGGHAAVAGELLEDVALAKRAKAAGYQIWFGPGTGVVRVRMYRSFDAMWEGWKKNLYLLVGGTPGAVWREMLSVVPWIPFVMVILALRFPLALVLGVGLLVARHAGYGSALSSNRFPVKFILYYVPGVLLYAGVLWESYRAHAKGVVHWKGRQVQVGRAGAASP